MTKEEFLKTKFIIGDRFDIGDVEFMWLHSDGFVRLNRSQQFEQFLNLKNLDMYFSREIYLDSGVRATLSENGDVVMEDQFQFISISKDDLGEIINFLRNVGGYA